MIRLDRFLSNMGKGTRTEVGRFIRLGQVTVNGMVVRNSSEKVDETKDLVTLMGEGVFFQKEIYLMLNKPAGYVTATEDNHHKTVLDLIKEPFYRARVAPAGRLDIDTEGFVFLTSDGDMNHYITGPKTHVRKRYYVKTKEEITSMQITKLQEGVSLDDGYPTRPAKVFILDSHSLHLDLTEGKFHQVKRMLKAVGNEVVYLKRVMMGNLELDEHLSPGEYRELTLEEQQLIRGS